MSTVLLPPETVFADEGPLRLGADSSGMLMTADEFRDVADFDDSFRYELIHGVVIVSPAPGPGERGPNDELGYWLRQYRDSHASGAVLNDTLSEHEVLTDQGVRRVDRAIWAGFPSPPDVQRDVPTIIVEFVSDTSRDRKRDYVDKRDEFARLGVAEYWVIDRFRRTLSVCVPHQPIAVLRENEVHTSPHLPGFELPLARLFALADRYRHP